MAMLNPRDQDSGLLGKIAMPDPAHVESIVRSHERCAALGMIRIGEPDHDPLPRGMVATWSPARLIAP